MHFAFPNKNSNTLPLINEINKKVIIKKEVRTHPNNLFWIISLSAPFLLSLPSQSVIAHEETWMLKQEGKENRNMYLCKLVLIQLGRDPTAFKVWVTNHYDQKRWCVRNTQGLLLVATAQACCRAKAELTNIKYSFEPPFIRWYFGKRRTRWPAMSPGLYILLPL